jgi:hypothetical protein
MKYQTEWFCIYPLNYFLFLQWAYRRQEIDLRQLSLIKEVLGKEVKQSNILYFNLYK